MPAIMRVLALLVSPTLALGLVMTSVPTARADGDAVGHTFKKPIGHTFKHPTTKKIQRALKTARRQVGAPYSYGASGPNSFDCSGLVNFSYRKAGFKKVPRTSRDQARFARSISKKALRPGDLMFFHNGGSIHHVAIFLRRKQGKIIMLHAPGSGQRVKRDNPWTSSWRAGTLR